MLHAGSELYSMPGLPACFLTLQHAAPLHRISDPDAAKPDDWDEDAPMMVADEDAEKPTGWLDDEPSDMPDPGRFHAAALCQ